MKKYLIILLSAIAFIACNTKPKDNAENNSVPQEKQVYMFTSFREPADKGLQFLYSYDGYKWDSIDGVFLKPEIGVEKVMRDPSIVVGPDGTFHLVWTSSWRKDLGFGYASSKDLINWSEQRLISVMAFDTTTINVWAPELFYNDENEDFIIVWASTVPRKFETGTTETEDNNHRLYYTKTKDFKTFTKAEVLYDPGYNSIDAVIVKRAPSDYVLVFKDNTRPERNLRVAFAKSATGPYGNQSPKFTENFTEGPSVIKIGDKWLIYFDVYKKKTYEAVSTEDFVTFTNINDKISVPQGHKHGTIFMASENILKGLLGKSEK